MLTHYLRIALRAFGRNKLYSLINIGCLAIGLAAVMTILLYILHEHSYDRWHANAKRIFSVSTQVSYGTIRWPTTLLSYPVGPGARAADPAVESTVRTKPATEGVELQNPASPAARFRETDRLLFADSNFFQFFSFRLLRGDRAAVLVRPNTVVLTETAAKKYFGTVDPVGKTLLMDKGTLLEVTGVAADMPSNSSIVFDMIASMSTMRAIDKYKPYFADQQVGSGYFNTWLLLRRPSDTAQVAKTLRELALTAAGKEQSLDRPALEIESHRFVLTPLADTHLKEGGGYHAKYLSAFTWVAVLILLLALVNYMSLATARSTMRAREVGVRKVIGAGRRKVAGQFYIESALYAVMAFTAGGVLFLACRSWFFRLMQLRIDVSFLVTPMVIGAFGALMLLVIGIAGSYPSLVLSSFRPVVVLYGRLSRHHGGERIRKGFLVFQFTLSMLLITCAFIIGKQLYFIRHTYTGVTRENIVMLPFSGTMENYAAYRSEVARIPGIRQVATSRFQLYTGGVMLNMAQLPGQSTRRQLMFMIADSGFIPMLGLAWKEKPVPGSAWYDRRHLALNEAAVEAFNWRGRATGNHFKFGDSTVTVAGVLRDFNFFPLHNAIQPLAVRVARRVEDEWPQGIAGVLYVKTAPHVNLPSLIDAVRRVYRRYDDRTAFDYTFLDDAFNSQYKSEDRLAGLLDIFSLITIVIACLGLFALATFAAQQRLKEIGIRKVLGASVNSISAQLSGDFLRPILISVAIASPVAWWVMKKWLQGFAYRTPINWWIFPAVGGGLLLIALGTVLVRTTRAAQVNPTVNLRSE